MVLDDYDDIDDDDDGDFKQYDVNLKKMMSTKYKNEVLLAVVKTLAFIHYYYYELVAAY